MVLAVKLRKFKRQAPQPGARERTLEQCEKFKRADAEAKRIAQEHGFDIPEIVC